VDGGSGGAGQRGHVEHEVGGVGAPVPRPAVLPPGVDADALVPRRAPHPGQRGPLWPRRHRRRRQQEPARLAARQVADGLGLLTVLSVNRNREGLSDVRSCDSSALSLNGPVGSYCMLRPNGGPR
jgi:hypothetical protein